MFFQENQLCFPTLFAAALDFLPIQGSAVPCERVFSLVKETMSPRRNRINAELMEALQMLKFTINRGQGLDFTCGTSKESELQTLELSMSEEVTVPEDINAFIQSLLAVDDIWIIFFVSLQNRMWAVSLAIAEPKPPWASRSKYSSASSLSPGCRELVGAEPKLS